MSEPRFGVWTPTTEALPKLPEGRKWPSVRVLATDGQAVRCLIWAANLPAKSVKGRLPRWEEHHRCLAWMTPTHWMPLPPPPSKEAADGP